MIPLCSAILMALVTGCGSSSSPSASGSTPQPSTPSATATQTTSTNSSVGVLSGEAKSAATGDIPDTQVFLTYANPAAGYRMSYPEGWTRKGNANDVTFSDKNNIVHIVIANGGAPSVATVAAELGQLKQSTPSLTFTPPASIQLKSGPAIKATYSTQSAPNPVTGKSVLLIVDRYEFAKGGKRATVDLGTAKGVDNVDAYRRMINSFTWQ